MDKKYTYYFGLGENVSEDLWEDDWDSNLINSAEWIYVLYTNTPITFSKFEEMILKSKDNIIQGRSQIFEYPSDFETYNNEDMLDIIDYDDIIFEIQELYEVSIGRSIVPLIWGDDCWESDENYDEYNPPELWRMEIYYY